MTLNCDDLKECPGGYCLEGSNSAGSATIDSSSCSSITNGRDRWYFEDNGDGYCTLKVGVLWCFHVFSKLPKTGRM